MAFDQSQYDLGANPFQGGGTYGEGRIGDALQRLRGLQSALQSGEIDYATYNKLFSQFSPKATELATSIGGQGSKAATAANNAGAGQLGQLSQIGGSQDLGTFTSLFKNLTGKDASAQDITGYFSTVAPELQSLPGGSGNVQDVHTLINQYLSDQYQPQIQGYQQQQQTNALNTAQQSAQDLIGKQNQETIQQLTSPENVERFKEAYNGSGMLDSGAFSQGVGNTLANAATGNISQALGGITIPGIQNIMGTQNLPYQQFQQDLPGNTAAFGQQQQSQKNFDQQASLAEQIANLQNPSKLQQWSPIIAGAEQGAGAAGGAATSYVCMELIHRGLADNRDLDLLHIKIMPALFTKARAFWVYALDAGKLVDAANRYGIDWSLWRARFLDNVLAEADAISAVNVYALACRDLAMECDESLWDERVLRSGFWDSMKFIPRLFIYKPFLKAFFKVLRIKAAFVHDIFPSEVSNG